MIVVPLALACVALVTPSERWRPWLLPLGAAAHLGVFACALYTGSRVSLDGWLAIDPLGVVVLGFVSVLFFLCALYAPAYLAARRARSNRIFTACLLGLLSMMSLICEAQHLGLMWVALEANTLVSAPVLYFNRGRRSLEATWKYLMISSVGVAIALLGTLFLGYAALHAGLGTSLSFETLMNEAPRLSRPWVEASFILLFVGYGTKMGLVPMHTWKPDAYGEAPGLVSTLLAGGLTSCAFLALCRFYRIACATGVGDMARDVMVVIGLLSMAVGGAFMVRQRDFKRMLAYSSVEHMGILAFALAMGGDAVFGSLLHMINNGLAKGVLFLSAGNIHRVFGSKLAEDVRGVLRALPVSGTLFLGGFFAITGSPPFGLFISELTILRATIDQGHFVFAGIFLLLLFIVFVGMGATVLPLVQGEPSPRRQSTGFTDRGMLVIPIAVCLVLLLLFGVFLPPPMEAALRLAARFVEGG